MVKVLFFGIAQDIAGSPSEEYDVQDTEALCHIIRERHPELGNIKFRLAINNIMLKGDSSLRNNDIVAVMPPFAGG